MAKWRVETRVTSLCIYFVDAENEKDAEAATCEMSAEYCEDENEETMSITRIDTPPQQPA